MKVALRTQQIIIDLPTVAAEPWINIVVQRVEMDDNLKPLNIVDRWGSVNVRMSAIATRVFQYYDPVNPLPGSISIAGMNVALTVAIVAMIVEKYGGRYDVAQNLLFIEG